MISFKNVTKKYGDKTVFLNFNLDINEHEITAVLGESGSGKTTLLNMIAGLTDFDGEITGVFNVSMVFQENRLVPHLTVEENILLVNENADVNNLLESVGLKDAKNLYPKELSAGMARRVAIVRAFSHPAPLLLMDEPLVNLDLSLKTSLFDRIKELKEKTGKTVIIVTHDVKEAALLSDRAIIISGGKAVFDRRGVSEKTLERKLLQVFSDGRNILL